MARFVACGTFAPSAAVMHFDADDRRADALVDVAYVDARRHTVGGWRLDLQLRLGRLSWWRLGRRCGLGRLDPGRGDGAEARDEEPTTARPSTRASRRRAR